MRVRGLPRDGAFARALTATRDEAVVVDDPRAASAALARWRSR